MAGIAYTVSLLVHIGLRVPLIVPVIILVAIVDPVVVGAGVVVYVVTPTLPYFPICVRAVVWRALLATVVAAAF